MPSQLMEMRGLKHQIDNLLHRHSIVATHGDAWIETRQSLHPALLPKVATHGDAWIETYNLKYFVVAKSQLMEMRGLKRLGYFY